MTITMAEKNFVAGVMFMKFTMNETEVTATKSGTEALVATGKTYNTCTKKTGEALDQKASPGVIVRAIYLLSLTAN